MKNWNQSHIDDLRAKGMVKDYTNQPNNRSIVIDHAEVFKKVKGKMKHTESDLQQNCVKNFRLIYPKLKMRLFSIPNGGYRNAITASILQAEGSMPGVCDLMLAVPNNKYGGMFIEMKSEGGRLSEYQVQFIKEMRDDYYCCVCRSVEQFLSEIKKYLEGLY